MQHSYQIAFPTYTATLFPLIFRRILPILPPLSAGKALSTDLHFFIKSKGFPMSGD